MEKDTITGKRRVGKCSLDEMNQVQKTDGLCNYLENLLYL